MKRFLSDPLLRFIDSGLLDYSYLESERYPIDLSLGINPLGCSDKVKDFLRSTNLDINNYPEVMSDSLRGKIGAVYGFEKEEILIGVGASELFHLCLLSFINQGDEVVMPKISFPGFEFLTILVGGKPDLIPFTADLDLEYERIQNLISQKTKAIIFCNPNNPTGKKLNKEEVKKLFSQNLDKIFIIDEANIDFGGESAIDLVKSNENLLVVRSFSKGFGLAGLRVGFIVGSVEIICALKRRQTPFTVNIFAQEAAKVALDDLGFLARSKTYSQTERAYLENCLSKLGYSFINSDSNYLLVNISSHFNDSKEFVERANKKGVNVVDGNNFRGLGGKFVRLCPRLHQINEAFIGVLKEI